MGGDRRAGRVHGRQMDLSRESRELINGFLDNVIACWHAVGYDYVRVEISLPLSAVSHVARDTAPGRSRTTGLGNR